VGIFQPCQDITFGYGIFDSPDVGEKNASEDRTEFDINFRYKIPGPLKGLDLRLRYASINGDYNNSLNDWEDYRFILNYRF